jgi:hypothetical protein
MPKFIYTLKERKKSRHLVVEIDEQQHWHDADDDEPCPVAVVGCIVLVLPQVGHSHAAVDRVAVRHVFKVRVHVRPHRLKKRFHKFKMI